MVMSPEELFQLMDSRRSIRRFLPTHVEWKKIVLMIHAGLTAPSEGNLQAWKLILVLDKNKKEALARASYNQMWMNQAYGMIVVVGEIDKVKRFYEEGEFYNILSSGAVVQNILLMAHSLGLGACWVSAFDEESVIDILKIKSGKKVMAIIPFGYPGEKPIKPRKESIFQQVFIDEFGNKVIDRDLDAGNFRVLNRSVNKANKFLLTFNNLPNLFYNLKSWFKSKFK